MKEGGFEGSANLIDNQMLMTKVIRKEGNNYNENSSGVCKRKITNNNCASLNESNSEETIYKHAVASKRGSSLS